MAGVALRHLGLLLPAPSLLTLLLLPILAWRRPGSGPGRPASGASAGGGRPGRASHRIALVVALVAGWLHGDGWHRGRARDCRLLLAEGDSVAVVGVVSGAWSRGALVRVTTGLPGGCRAELRVGSGGVGGRPVALGRTVRVTGRWRSWAGGAADPEMAGEVRGGVETVAAGSGEHGDGRLAGWREAARRRVERLFPERHGLVAALVLARKDGVDPAVKEAFTLAGVAHLLAISGFHVGVIAVVVLGSLRAAGVRKRPATVAGTLVVWAYVAFIGAPDAAVRAALLLGLVGAGVLRGRPVHGVGALSAALLLFTAVDPGAPGRAGFQLSFLGAAGLVLLGPVLDRGLERRLGWKRGAALRSAVAVGVAATLATLPAVAWHFDRVSVVGIPVTLVATPLVAVALPGVLAAAVADALPLVPHAAAAFLAGGADLLLAVLVELVERAAEPSWASLAVPRGVVLAGALGAACGGALLPPARRVGRDVRLAVAVGSAAGATLLLAPVGAAVTSGTLEIVALDVGQGDAVAVRSPRGRWLLVDAGPGPPRGSTADPPVLARLRERGVTRLAALLLTHPDLDHIGGAAAVIGSLRPGFVGGPGHVRGTEAYLAGLTAGTGVGDAAPPGDCAPGCPPGRGSAGAPSGSPWVVLRTGDVLDLDGALLRVLHPPTRPDPAGEPNASSLVVLLEWRGFTALLTGDAPAAVEEGVAAEAGDVDVLKVSHHGSLTSTSDAFLDAVTPEVALVSAGRRNRFGHPHPVVLGRLEARGMTVLRTDASGSVRVVAERDGGWRVARSHTP